MRNKFTFLSVFAVFAAALLFNCTSPLTPKERTNKLNVRLEAPVGALNPHVAASAYPRMIAANIFQTLGAFDPRTIELKPLLVKSIPTPVLVTEGLKTGMQAYIFELRDEAKWDNGTPVTAEDINFSYKVVLNPLLNTVFRSYFDLVKDFDIDPSNPKKFTVYLSDYYFLGIESLCQMPIFPKYNYDPQGLLNKVTIADLADSKKSALLSKQDKGLQEHAIFFAQAALNSDKDKVTASGAYKVAFIDANQGVILVRKKDWWGNGLAATFPAFAVYPDTIHYKYVKAEDAAINMLRSGEIDITGGLTPANFKKLREDPVLSETYDFTVQWAALFNRILINNADPILADKKVRQALAQAVDYDEMLTDIQLGMAQRTISQIHPNQEIYAKNIVPYTLSIDKAKALLAEAGWTDSDNDGIADKVIGGKKTPLVLQIMNTTGMGVGDLISASLQTSMAKAGIKIELKPLDLPQISRETQAGNYQLAALAASTHPGEIELAQNYHSKFIAPRGDNRARIANKALDGVLDQIRITPNKAARILLFQKAQEIIYEEVPEIYLYCPSYRLISSKDFDFTFSPMRPGYVEGLTKLKK